jgi:hypothetical protein
MMVTAREERGHFAVIQNGCNITHMTNVVQLEQHRKRRGFAMQDQPQFEETIPTDFGGLNERRNYTPEGMRIGMLLLIASAAVMTLAIIVIAATLGA